MTMQPSLGELDYQPESRHPARRRLGEYLLAVLSVAAALVVTAILLPPLGSATGYDATFALTVAALAVVLVLLAQTAFDAIRARPVTIRRGVLYLPFPVRRASGAKERRIELGDVADAVPTINRLGYNGLSLVLPDGTHVFLAQSSFGPRGTDIFGTIASRFGRDYQLELKRILLAGTQYRFRVVELREVRGDSAFLKGRVRTSSGRAMRELRADTVSSVEPVRTGYLGPAYLVTLTDGTRFLLGKPPADEAGLFLIPSWSSKLVVGPAAHG